MSDPKPQTNWLPWIIAAGAKDFAFQRPANVDPKPADIKGVVASTLPNIRAAYRAAFLEAASKIEKREIVNQEQWTQFIAANAGAKQREALDRVYNAIDELKLPASFEGKESEIAKLNRDIAGAW
jgi:hypothetical protein